MKRPLIGTTLACLLSATAGPGLAQDSVQATDFIELFAKLGGSYPGFRKAHARGLCASGSFAPAGDSRFQRAALLSNGERPVTLRFSVGGPNPESDERVPGTRGVGIRIGICIAISAAEGIVDGGIILCASSHGNHQEQTEHKQN